MGVCVCGFLDMSMRGTFTPSRGAKRRFSSASTASSAGSFPKWKRRKVTGRMRRAGVPRAGVGYLRTGGFYGTDELKFHDIAITDALIAANGNIAEDSVLTIAQGDGEQERDGRKMVVKKIGWKFSMVLQAIDAGTPQFAEGVRVILYHDTQTNGATATVSGSGGILAADDFHSFNNLETGKRFRTLMDRTYSLSPHAGGGTDTGQYRIDDSFYKNDCNIPVTYNSSATTGAIATMMDNNIGVLLLSDQGSVVAFTSRMRIRFLG